MAEDDVTSVNPFAVPDGQHGWRGLGAPGDRKRKWYAVLQNEFVLVTALVVLPGERSVRHFHETGELNISFAGQNQPVVRWNSPGALHGGASELPGAPAEQPSLMAALARLSTSSPDLAEVLSSLLGRQEQMEQALADITRPQPGLRVGIDVLFPPFRTTIDDPAYPDKRTITGQWYD
jgi:hypothetical protein